MPKHTDQYEPVVDYSMTGVPLSWGPAPTPSVSPGECTCPADCAHDHENE